MERISQDTELFAGPPELSANAIEIHGCIDCLEETPGPIDSPPPVCFQCGSEDIVLLGFTEPGAANCNFYVLGNVEAAA